jgi:hypothetical protein
MSYLQFDKHVLFFLQHPVNPPVYPVSPVLLSKKSVVGCKRSGPVLRNRGAEGFSAESLHGVKWERPEFKPHLGARLRG